MEHNEGHVFQYTKGDGVFQVIVLPAEYQQDFTTLVRILRVNKPGRAWRGVISDTETTIKVADETIVVGTTFKQYMKVLEKKGWKFFSHATMVFTASDITDLKMGRTPVELLERSQELLKLDLDNGGFLS